MKKDIISVDDYILKANVEKDVCPLDWLVAFYREYPGKLVMLDKNLLSYLLNKAHYDKIETTEFDGYKQTFTILWNATEKWPETKVIVSSYGRDAIQKGEKFEVYSDENYYVIEELYAEDILVNDARYAENMMTDEQFIMLVSKPLDKQKYPEM